MSIEPAAALARREAQIRRRDTILAGLESFRGVDPGITVTGIVTFLYVCENEGISMTELASIAGLRTATASRAVRALGVPGARGSLPPSLGLVDVRNFGPHLNSKTLFLTDAGRDLKDRLNGLIRGAVTIDG